MRRIVAMAVLGALALTGCRSPGGWDGDPTYVDDTKPVPWDTSGPWEEEVYDDPPTNTRPPIEPWEVYNEP